MLISKCYVQIHLMLYVQCKKLLMPPNVVPIYREIIVTNSYIYGKIAA